MRRQSEWNEDGVVKEGDAALENKYREVYNAVRQKLYDYSLSSKKGVSVSQICNSPSVPKTDYSSVRDILSHASWSLPRGVGTISGQLYIYNARIAFVQNTPRDASASVPTEVEPPAHPEREEKADSISCATSEKVYVADLSTDDHSSFRSETDQDDEDANALKMDISRSAAIPQNLLEQFNEDIPLFKAFKVDPNDFETASVDLLHLNGRAKNALSRMHLFTVGAVLSMTLGQIQSIPNIGKGSAEEIITRVQKHISGLEISETTVSREPKSSNKEMDLSIAETFDVEADSYREYNIELLYLSVRSYNCLHGANKDTVADILLMSPNELRSIRNMGVRSVNEIIQKTQEFILDPRNKRKEVAVPEAFSPQFQNNLSPDFKNAVEALLMGESYSSSDLTEAQHEYLSKLKAAVELLGVDVCLEAYTNPKYCFEISSVLSDYALPFMKRCEARCNYAQKITALSKEMRERKVVPLIRAYSAQVGEKLPYFEAQCEGIASLAQIPTLFDSSHEGLDLNLLIRETDRFFKWLNFDIKEQIDIIIDKIKKVLSQSGERSTGIYLLRTAGRTLEEVGNIYGVTRERVRQIEKKTYKNFWHTYVHQRFDLIMLLYALRDGDNALYYDELTTILGEEFTNVLWACEKNSPIHKTHYFSKTLNAIIIRDDGSSVKDETILLTAVNEILSEMPELIESSQKKSLIEGLAKEHSVPIEILKNAFNSVYRDYKTVYHKGRMTVVNMCAYILKHRFPGGYKIGDESEANRFRQYSVEFFGEHASTMTDRAIDAKIGEMGVLCDRGKYIHPDFLIVDPQILDRVNEYIEESPRSLLTYGEIFDALRAIFEGTQITNRYLLQGALKKYGCKFGTGRDFIRKTPSVTFVDELESFVEAHGIVHKSEILAAFSSLGETGLGQVAARSSNVFNIENGYYLHASVFDIQPVDYTRLRDYLMEACSCIPVNIRSAFDVISKEYPDFIQRNNIEDRNMLYAALNYMFRDEFSFSRPYIAKLGMSDITNRGVILQHISDYDSIEIEELIDICDTNGIHYIAPSYLCQSVAPDFIRIDRTTLTRRELTGITDDVINDAARIVREMLHGRDYIVGSKVQDYSEFPQIEVDWNEFLLENLIFQSKKVDVVYLIGDPFKHPNAVYVSEKYKGDTFTSFLVKILTGEVRKGRFQSKVELRDWLREEGLIEGKLPNILESGEYFYVSEHGVRCSNEIITDSTGRSDSCNDHVLEYLSQNNIEYVDLRSKQGCLWIVADEDIEHLLDPLRDAGMSLKFKPEGGTATNGRSAYWTKDTYAGSVLKPQPIKSLPRITNRTGALADVRRKIEWTAPFVLEHTKPEMFIYKGEQVLVSSWADLYIKLLAKIHEDHPRLLAPNMCLAEKDNGNIELGDVSSASAMRKPRELPDTGIFVELNLSAKDIAGRIKHVLDLCSIEYGDVAVYYCGGNDTQNSVGTCKPFSSSEPLTSSKLTPPIYGDGYYIDRAEELILKADLTGLTIDDLVNQLRMPIATAKRVIQKSMNIVSICGKLLHKEAFMDWKDGADKLEAIIEKLMSRNNGYASDAQLYEYARAEMQMFLNDNDMDDSRKVFDLAEHLFCKESYHGKRYTFSAKTHISQSSESIGSIFDIICKYARDEGGFVDEQNLADYLQHIGVKTSYLRQKMRVYEEPVFLFYQPGCFITVESMGINDEWLNKTSHALLSLFADAGDHVVLRDIQPWWYNLLPELPNGRPWTALLLQSVLRHYSKKLGARTICGLINQTGDTLHAMLVSLNSEVQTFSDAVISVLLDEKIEQRRFGAEELRLMLVRRGLLDGNELMWNMPKALPNDGRFAWDADGQNVTVNI